MTTNLGESAAEQPTDSLTKQSRKARLRKGLITGCTNVEKVFEDNPKDDWYLKEKAQYEAKRGT